MRAGVFGRTVVLSFGLMGFAGGLEPAQAEHAAKHELEAPSCVPRALCCKKCDGGKACGDSCIGRSRGCYEVRGCACDSDEICE
ncbi:MAG TPA: hypothetical protein VFZ53_13165 [Polyangiaceae bacterium]